MENFDDLYKKHFQNENDPVSPQESDQLWDSIVEELGPAHSVTSAAQTSATGLSTIMKSLLFGSIIVGAFFAGTLYSKYSNPASQYNFTFSDKSINQTPINTAENEILNTELNNLNTTENQVNSTEIQYNSQSDKDKISTLSDTHTSSSDVRSENEQLHNTSSNSTVHNVKESISYNESIVNRQETQSNYDSSLPASNSADENIVSSEKSVETINDQTTELSSAELASNLNDVSNSNETNSAENDNPQDISIDADIDESNFYEIEKLNPELIPFHKLKEPILTSENIPAKNIIIDGGLAAGINRSGVLYTGNNTELVKGKNDTERAYFGYLVSAEIGASYKRNWLFNTGLQYELQQTIHNSSFYRLIDRNEKVTTGILISKDDYEVLKENEADSMYVHKSLNRLQQINSFRSFTVPVQFGWKTSQDKFNYGFYTGVKIRLRQAQVGKMLNAQRELIDINSTLGLFYNNLNFGFNFSPFAEMKIADRTSLRVAYVLDYYQPSISSDQSLNLHNFLHTIKVGARYSLY